MGGRLGGRAWKSSLTNAISDSVCMTRNHKTRAPNPIAMCPAELGAQASVIDLVNYCNSRRDKLAGHVYTTNRLHLTMPNASTPGQ